MNGLCRTAGDLHDYVAYPSLIPGAVMQALIWLGVVLVVFWAVLWLGLKIATGFIHVLFLVGLVLVMWGLIKRGARAIT
jgi:hypothetical protein